MNSFTFPVRLFFRKSPICIGLLFIAVSLFSREKTLPPIVLQCPIDLVVDPLPGECGFLLDFNTLIWSADVPLLSSSFSPGPGYVFPTGTTPVTLTVTDSLGDMEMCTFNVTLLPHTSMLDCSNSVVVEFEGECTREISPFEILQGGPYACEESYIVDISSPSGGYLGNVVDTSFIGNTYTVQVSDAAGSTCWGALVVQSTGMPQVMTCPPDVTIFCHEPYSSVGFPTIEGCFSSEDYTHTYFDVKNNSFCDGDNIAFTVNRQWTSTDPMGNQTICNQLISAKRIGFSDIDFPLNFDGIDLPKLSCSDTVNIAMDANTSITGIPLVNGFDPTTVACNLTFLVSDSMENTCGNHYIIKRKWEAFDYCLDQFFAHTQIIILADEEGPVFSVPDTILFSNNNDCTGTVLLPSINLIEECSGYGVMIETPWNTFNTDSVYASMSSTPGFYDVIYTATDFCGNIGKDTVIVLVSAGLDALCLDGVDITADYYLENLQTALNANDFSVLDEFGTPSYFANCTFDPVQVVNVDLDACYEGIITREHTVELDGMPISCSQTIRVNHVSDFVVQFPANTNVNCGQGIPDFGEPTIFYESCELMAVTYEDVVYMNEPNACYKIVRTWSVINWCVAGAELDNEVIEESELQLSQSGCLDIPFCDFNNDGSCDKYTFRDSWSSCVLPDADDAKNSTGPDTDPDADPWDGYISYLQIIKVNDSVDPVFTDSCDMPDVCITDNSCTLDLVLPTPEVEDCYFDPTITYSIRIGSIWKNGIGPYPNIAPGNYPVRYVATDNCNNKTTCETILKVVDCTPPTLVCEDMVEVSLGQSQQGAPSIEVLASSLVGSSDDNCIGLLEYSFSTDMNQVSQIFYCEDLGLNMVEIWAADNGGNQSSCTTNLIISNYSQLNCDQGLPELGGNIDNEFGIGIGNVNVKNSLNYPSQTNSFGSYFIHNQQLAYPFSISPEKNNDHTNGVTTFDIVLLTRHILGVSLLDSPFKIIAADANRSNTVTTFDAVEIRKLILGINAAFPSNTSWRFVESDYQFNDPYNPFSPPLPDTFSVNSPNVNTLDFIGVKIGDLNGSASVDFSEPTGDRNLVGHALLEIMDKWCEEGEIIEVPVELETDNIIGFQTTMKFDDENLAFIKIKPGFLSDQHFAYSKSKGSGLNISFNQPDPILLDKKFPLFTLVFAVKGEGHLFDWIRINQEGIASEAYTGELELRELGLHFEHLPISEESAIISPARPNPFSDKTILPFYLPDEGNVKCTFFSTNGKVLHSLDTDFPKGISQLEIKAGDLGKGLILFRFETKHGATLGKLVVVD